MRGKKVIRGDNSKLIKQFEFRFQSITKSITPDSPTKDKNR